ncbi:Gamma-taxilin [Chelonia mydas]|uniref:Gamma-taxilin n=1 Tax=Chelonia mydas TaxID=8469 RepID=M7AS22_CHEMY|nr:Gamma-taxilin [Chelonia mydas]
MVRTGETVRPKTPPVGIKSQLKPQEDEEEISTSPGVSEFVSDAFDECNLNQEDLRKEMEQLVLDKKEKETSIVEGDPADYREDLMTHVFLSCSYENLTLSGSPEDISVNGRFQPKKLYKRRNVIAKCKLQGSVPSNMYFMIGTTGEAGICGIGMNTQDQLVNSKCVESGTTLQHLQSNCDGIESTAALEDENYISKNRKPVDSMYCTQESREETPGREEARTEPPDGEQDPETEKNKEKTLGKEVLLLMQALNTLSTPEEKLAALCKKYADLSWKATEPALIQAVPAAQASPSPDLSELNADDGLKRITDQPSMPGTFDAAKDPIELSAASPLLYGENPRAPMPQAPLRENMQQAREEEERRKEATAHFQITLNEIQAQLEQHDIHNAKLRQENIELGEKLKKLIEQYALREEHIDKVFKHKELQQQLVDAKLQQTTQLIKEAEEKHQREREFLLKEATESRHKCEQMKQQEAQLKQQLSLYMDKFEEFQTTMAKSNELFTTFRQEMEKMTKKIKKLEKETIVWRTKWENNNKALLQMAEEKTVRDKEYKGFQIKLERLEKLCRALQTERNELNEKVEVLKEQVSVKEADVDLAVQVLQSCTLNSHEELGTSTDTEPGIQSDAESNAANEGNGSEKTVSTSPVPVD